MNGRREWTSHVAEGSCESRPSGYVLELNPFLLRAAYLLGPPHGSELIPPCCHGRYKRADAASVLEVPASAASAVRAASRPFVEWLEQAESSEEDSDEE